MKEDISNENLSKMIENILNGKSQDVIMPQNEYVDEKAEAFLKSLRDMVK